MSLKAIKEAVAQLHETNPYRRKAEEQIAALEKVAKIVARATEMGWPSTPMGQLNLQHSFELLATIAKEAP